VSAPDHERFRDAIDAARARYVPGLMLAEVDYFLRDERAAMRAFMDDLAQGAFTYAPPTSGQLDRAMKIDEHDADLSLGLVEASVIALAERVDVHRIATRDIRHFRRGSSARWQPLRDRGSSDRPRSILIAPELGSARVRAARGLVSTPGLFAVCSGTETSPSHIAT